MNLGIHCHNDCDVAMANSLAAVAQGAVQVQGTINGIGERCGNVDLVSVIANLTLKRGHEVLQPGSLARLTDVSRYVYETANMNFRNGQPFVGASAFAHKGGMHTHAVARNTASYEHIDPSVVGNERRVLVSELSGQSTILTKTTKYAIANDRPLMAKILGQVQDLENAGYEFEAAEASFDLLVQKAAGIYRPWFERLSYRVDIEAGPKGEPLTEARVKVRVGAQEMHTVSEGDGPVNALDGALRKALQPMYPRLAEMHLADYKVRRGQRPRGDGGAGARGDGVARRRRGVGNGGCERKHRGSELAGTGRRGGVQIVQRRRNAEAVPKRRRRNEYSHPIAGFTAAAGEGRPMASRLALRPIRRAGRPGGLRASPAASGRPATPPGGRLHRDQ